MNVAWRVKARAIERALFRPVDIAWLAAYRVLLGGLLAFSLQRFLAYGWVDELLVEPKFRFHYYGFAWVEPLARAPMHLLFWALTGLGVAVAAGFAFRVTAPLFAAGFTYIQLIDVSTYLNHYYLAALLTWLLALSPANRAFSVDAWLARRVRGRTRTPHVATAWHLLFRVQVGVVYVCAALAKLQSDWLLHGQPLGIWLGASTDLPLVGRLFTLPGVPLAMSWCGFLFDLTVVGWLLWRRTRAVAFLVLLVFHASTRMLFDIGMFPLIMTVSALVFFPPSWPRLSKACAAPAPARDDAPARATTGLRRGAVALGALYALIQIAVPLRCHLYGGNVLWHEQGMRFSWRVMVRAKGGATTFHVLQKSTGREFLVSPRDYLTPFQENEMSGQPDLILQLAHRIADEFRSHGYGPVEVRAETMVSVNGRRGAPLVDPAVDLVPVRDGLAPAPWILPAPDSPPPPTRPVL